MLRTSEGRDGRFMVWQGGKGRGGERDITAMKEKQRCGNGNRTYCKTNKGLVYESVEVSQSQSGTTRRHGTVLGRTKKRNGGKIKL